ncbi:phospho-sugar mutase [Shewanella sp. SR44-3]|uniref:phospho-sugar mutase n=1 Tax=Shewanella sp. SR44-3 TaxID=2760936 RepID=UPI0015FDE2E6|nr:phospho-sugar mutase [Shewanella sp. SR44-3]MBB1270539.1 phospho-sugar mutase [Shewanella sp. SR44-3]
MNSQLQFQVNHWLNQIKDDSEKQALMSLIEQGDEAKIAACFSGRLAFGTAGIRGIVGPGPMGMNRLVVRQTTAGLGNYLTAQMKDACQRGVVIGYDGRHDSRQFAHDAAGVLTAMGFKVFLTAKVAPTPLVAFGVKHFGAAAGIVVTASHNPPAYNGYKVYWHNGAQIIPPHDSGIAACIEQAATQELPFIELIDATKQDKLHWLMDDFFEAYRHQIYHAGVLQFGGEKADDGKLFTPGADNISLAYTAMHGVGANMAETVLKDAGFNRVYSVAAQREPDGDFPTVNFPNPEEPGAMDLVIAEAKLHNAMLACANDPDADRFAVAVRKDDGEYQPLTGDQVGVLLGHYLLSHSNPDQRLVGCTIVSSSLLSKIAAGFNAHYYTTLTGFKWLMNVGIAQSSPHSRFLFAYEEALGYTVGNLVWDKDGLSAIVAFAKLCAELSCKNQTIWDRLTEIYQQHGYHLNTQVSIATSGDAGGIGAKLRADTVQQIGGFGVQACADLNASEKRYADGHVDTLDLPKSDVLIYELEQGLRVIVRPSGTEPKVKCYYEVCLPMLAGETLTQVRERAQLKMSALINAHQASL